VDGLDGGSAMSDVVLVMLVGGRRPLTRQRRARERQRLRLSKRAGKSGSSLITWHGHLQLKDT
jgi:hypothetical protein